MDTTRLIVCVLASLPAGWFAGVLHERVPAKPRPPLFTPFPGVVLRGARLTIHVLTTALFVLAAVRFEDAGPLELLAFLLFFTAAASLAVIDFSTLRLPDPIVAGTLMLAIPAVVVASIAASEPERIQYALAGGATYFGFLLLTHLAFPRGMGFGDVKLAALMGLFVGWVASSAMTALVLVFYSMFMGFLVGSFAGMLLFAFRGRSRHYPFGPFLIGGAVAAIALSNGLLPAA